MQHTEWVWVGGYHTLKSGQLLLVTPSMMPQELVRLAGWLQVREGAAAPLPFSTPESECLAWPWPASRPTLATRPAARVRRARGPPCLCSLQPAACSVQPTACARAPCASQGHASCMGGREGPSWHAVAAQMHAESELAALHGRLVCVGGGGGSVCPHLHACLTLRPCALCAAPCPGCAANYIVAVSLVDLPSPAVRAEPMWPMPMVQYMYTYAALGQYGFSGALVESMVQ